MEEIKSSLLAVLPDLDSALLNEVVDHLVKEVGVKVPEDFKFIEYDDLPMLKPIQRRKYLDNLKKEKTEHQPSTSAPRQDERQLTPTDTASPQGVCVFTNPTLTEVDVESQLQKTPCLVVVGETLLMADRYMLAIDGIIVNNSIPNFTVGLLMMCFVGINPDKGTKAEKKKNRAHHTPVEKVD
ncbi:hypothetical protein Pcinc_013454 [Petrolisthes cinctipes]|uniref:Uncharacterized protein n=1 Tax=Petrolisthes cinctipes TaxID=88211 RepID=A0AAE1FWZ1_PETCI|nr:hypothetical protein Pcinc_013454 [Petrolisthes cinctipes]